MTAYTVCKLIELGNFIGQTCTQFQERPNCGEKVSYFLFKYAELRLDDTNDMHFCKSSQEADLHPLQTCSDEQF